MFGSKSFISSLFISICALGAVAHADEYFSGRLRLAPGAEVMLAGQRRAVPLVDGEISIRYDSPGLWSLFSDARKLILTQGARSGEIALTSDDFSSFGSFRTGPAGGQSFYLEGRTESRVTGTAQVSTSRYCTYAGYCLACSPGLSFDGKFEMSCSFKYNLLCSGQEAVEVARTNTENRAVIRLMSVTGDEELGEIRGPAEYASSDRVLQVTGSCQ